MIALCGRQIWPSSYWSIGPRSLLLYLLAPGRGPMAWEPLYCMAIQALAQGAFTMPKDTKSSFGALMGIYEFHALRSRVMVPGPSYLLRC